MDSNKPVSNVRKPRKDDLDIVTTELKKGFEWTTKHTTLVVGLLGLLIVVGGGYAIYSTVAKNKEIELQAKYYDLEAVVTKKRGDFEMAKNPPPVTPDQPAPPATAKPSGDLQKDYGDVTAQLADFAKTNPSTTAGSMAALNLASLQAEYNQTEAAISTLKTVNPPKSFLGALVQMELATQLANANNCPEATGIWQKLIDTPSAAFLKGEAKLKMGLCAEATGDLTKAQSFYSEVEKDYKDTAAGRSASQYLRLLSMKNDAPKTN